MSIPRQLPGGPLSGSLLGREAELQALAARLQRPGVTYLVGEVGSGKTTLAAEAVRGLIGDSEASLQGSPFPDGVVLLDLRRAQPLLTDPWGVLAQTLNPGTDRTRPLEKQIAQACDNRRFLVIIEGAEVAQNLNSRLQLQALLGLCGKRSHRLVLSRNTQNTGHHQRIQLGALPPEAAGALLDRLVAGDLDPEARQGLLVRLRGNPLALTWAAGLLKSGGRSLPQWLAAWDASGPTPEAPIERLLEWLLGQGAQTLTPADREVLAATGLLAHAEMPMEALRAAVSHGEHLRHGLNRLVQLNWLRPAPQAHQKSSAGELAHSAVYEYARTGRLRQEAARRVERWLSGMLQQCLETGDGAALRRILLNARALLEADSDQQHKVLAGLCAYEAFEDTRNAGQLDLVELILSMVYHWQEKFPETFKASPEWQRERFLNEQGLGDLHRLRRDYKTALKHYEHCRVFFERMVEQHPRDREWMNDLGICYDKLGRLFQEQNKTQSALRWLILGREIGAAMVQMQPDDAQLQHSLGISYSSVGEAFRTLNKSLEAEDNLTRGTIVLRRLVGAHPDVTKYRVELAICLNTLADVQEREGELTIALNTHTERMHHVEKLMRDHPTSLQWQREMAATLQSLGLIHQRRKALEEALSYQMRAVEIMERVVRTAPTTLEWQFDLSCTLASVVDVHILQKDSLPLALQFAEQCRSLREHLVSAHPEHPEHALWRSKLGEIRQLEKKLRLLVKNA